MIVTNSFPGDNNDKLKWIQGYDPEKLDTQIMWS